MSSKATRALMFASKALCLLALAALVWGYNSWVGAAQAADDAVREQIAQAQRLASRGPYAVEDGVYTGSAQGYGGLVTVEVSVRNGYIEQLVCTDHAHEDAAWWDMAKVLLETIPQEQSTEVDVISSATYTSAGIINATRAALLAAPAFEGEGA